MEKVFADADYWIALLNPNEQLHTKAKAVSQCLGQVRVATSEMMLAEVLAFYAGRGPALRNAAADVASKLTANPNATVVPQTSIQFQNALALYRDREDKEWSLTDCASILIMQAEAITEALTYDEHFQQAGFKALLRESS